jgi:hypothetical protein
MFFYGRTTAAGQHKTPDIGKMQISAEKLTPDIKKANFSWLCLLNYYGGIHILYIFLAGVKTNFFRATSLLMCCVLPMTMPWGVLLSHIIKKTHTSQN